MKILYTECSWGEIVLFEGPPGSKVFWPDGYPVPRSRKRRRGTWSTMKTVKDSLKPRARIVAASYEIRDTPGRLKQAIRFAASRLPPSYQKRGLLGVALKGEPYTAEGKSWRLVSFFYIPSAKAWTALYDDLDCSFVPYNLAAAFKAPEGMPAKTWW